jgi:hypothetical protein
MLRQDTIERIALSPVASDDRPCVPDALFSCSSCVIQGSVNQIRLARTNFVPTRVTTLSAKQETDDD